MKIRDDVVIVSKNMEQVTWLNRRGIYGKLKPTIHPEDAIGKHIIGAVPLQIAEKAKTVSIIDCKPMGLLKTKDMSTEQLEANGAKLKTYVIIPCNEDQSKELFNGFSY